MPGPKKTAAVIKLIRGTHRRDRDGPRPPLQAQAQINLVAPDWLSPMARESWDYVVANMPPGTLRLIDRGILQIFACAEATYREASMRVNELGAVVKLDGQAAISPFVRIRDKQATILLAAAVALGIGAANRGSAIPSGANPFSNNGRPPAA